MTKSNTHTLGKLRFYCSGGNAEKVKSQDLEVTDKYVRVYLYRYGLVERDSNYDLGWSWDIQKRRDKEKTLPSDSKKTKTSIKDVEVTNNEMPYVDKFYVARTFLRKGYIYLIKKDDNNYYKEYAVNESGKLTEIIWEGGKNEDVRNPTGKARQYITLHPKKLGEYYIAFSPVQWCKKMFNDINGSDSKKQQYMQTIKLAGIKIDEKATSDEVVSYKEVKVVYYDKHPQSEEFKETLKRIDVDEKKETEKGDNEFYEDMFVTLNDAVGCAEDIYEALDEKTMQFRALVRAIQTGETITDAYKRLSKSPPEEAPKPPKEYQDMFGLALASYQMVYANKQNTQTYDGGKVGRNWGDTNFPHQPHSKPEYEIRINPKSKSDFGVVKKVQTNNYVHNEYISDGLHRDKVENILGVKQRREKRSTVIKYRNLLGDFLLSDYLNEALKYYTVNKNEYCVSGIAFLYEKLELLCQNPYNIDRNLLLPESNKHEKGNTYKSYDPWVSWFYKQTDETQKASSKEDAFKYLLLHNQLTIEQKLLNNWVDLSNKLAVVCVAKLGLYAVNENYFKYKKVKVDGVIQHQKIIKEGYERALKKLNKITVKLSSGEVIKLFIFSNTHGFEIDARAFGASFAPNLETVFEGKGKKVIDKIKADYIKHKRLYGKAAKKAGGSHLITVGDEVENITKKEYIKNKIAENSAKRYNEKAYKILNSRKFTTVITGLQIINFTHACSRLVDDFKEGKTGMEKIVSGVNLVGITAELSEASLKLNQAHLISIGKEGTDKFTKLGGRAKLAGAIGGIVTVGMCAWDAHLAFDRNDNDAGFAWLGAGVAFAISTAAGILGTSVFILSGPVGWIAFGVGFGLVALAYIFTDSDLEFYFKHFVLCDHKALPLKEGESPMDYNRRVFKNRAILIKGEDDDAKKKIKTTLMHPTDAITRLNDITVCSKELAFKMPTTYKYILKDVTYRNGVGYGIYGFTISIIFNQLLNSAEQLKTPQGVILKEGVKEDIFNLIVKDTKVQSLEKQQTELTTTIVLPTKYRFLKAKELYKTQFMVLLKISVNDKEFPYMFKEEVEERFLAVRLPLVSRYSGGNRVNTSEMFIGTKKEIIKNRW